MKFVFASLLFAFVTFAHAASLDVDDSLFSHSGKINAKLELTDEEYSPSISWFLDGKRIREFDNKNKITISADSSKEHILKVKLVFANKQKVLQRKIDRKKSFLIWEHVSFLPFSLGISSYASEQAKLRLEFLSNEDNFDREKMIYLWKLNDAPYPGLSGKGRYIAFFNLPAFESSAHVEVVAKDPINLKTIAKASTYIEYKKPEILFFTKDEYSMWNFSAKDEVNLSNTLELLVLPLGFSYSYLFDDLLEWELFVDNIRQIESKEATPFLRLSSNEKKDANLRIKIKHKELFLQQAESNLKIRQTSRERVNNTLDNADTSDTSGFGI